MAVNSMFKKKPVSEANTTKKNPRELVCVKLYELGSTYTYLNGYSSGSPYHSEKVSNYIDQLMQKLAIPRYKDELKNLIDIGALTGYNYTSDGLDTYTLTDDYYAVIHIESKNNGFVIRGYISPNNMSVELTYASFPEKHVDVYEFTEIVDNEEHTMRTITKDIYQDFSLVNSTEQTFNVFKNATSQKSFCLSTEAYVMGDTLYEKRFLVGNDYPFVETSLKYFRTDDYQVTNLKDKNDLTFNSYVEPTREEISEEEFNEIFKRCNNPYLALLTLNNNPQNK